MNPQGGKSTVQPQASGLEPSTNPQDWKWQFWPVVPLYPYGKRRSLCIELVANNCDVIYTRLPTSSGLESEMVNPKIQRARY